MRPAQNAAGRKFFVRLYLALSAPLTTLMLLRTGRGMRLRCGTSLWRRMSLRRIVVFVLIDRVAHIILPLVHLLPFLRSQLASIGRAVRRSLVVDAGHEDAASTSDGGASLDVVGVDKKQLGPNEDHRVESLWRC